jgi:archaellum component FlaC
MKSPMAKITLATLLAVIEKNEAKNDDRFQLIKQDLESIRSEFDENFDGIGKQFGEINKRFDGIGKQFGEINKRFDGIDKRFGEIDKRFDGIDKRFDKQDRTLELIAMQTASTMNTVSDHERRIRKLEVPKNN